MRMRIWLMAILALSLVAAACGGDDDDAAATETTVAESTDTTAAEDMEEMGTIVDVAVGAGSFGTLVTALEAAGLVETLQGEGPFTVFAPTDDAFAALPEGTLDGLLADTDALTDVLLYHVVEGKVLAEDVVNLTSATTVQGSDISIAVVDSSVILNDTVMVTATNIEASNGVIHVIDAVLIPPTS